MTNKKPPFPIEHIPATELNPNPNNPRFITTERFARLVKSLKDCPDLFEARPCLCSNRTGENIVLGGNMRYRAALAINEEAREKGKELPWERIPAIIIPNLTEDQERDIAVRDNGTEFGEWDFDQLAAWDDLPLIDMGVDLPEDWMKPPEDEPPKDAVPKTEMAEQLLRKWKVKPGDLWEIGQHRLVCGDATEEDDYKLLLQGERAGVTFIDPPYGVSYKGGPEGQWEMIKNDQLRDVELFNFLTAAFSRIRDFTQDNTSLYCWHANNTQIEFELALRAAGFTVRQQLIWNRGMSLGFVDYHWSHEPMFYCKKTGQKATWYGDRKAKTLLRKKRTEIQQMKKAELLEILQAIIDDATTWEIDKKVEIYKHPNQKPLELAIRAIKNSSETNALVLDTFLGSGTSMLAAENTGRRSRAIEKDPKYCAVALERMTDAFPGIKIQRRETK